MTHTLHVNDAHVRELLDATLGDSRMRSGTRVAHALHDLFLEEARQQGHVAADLAWAALDAPTIREIARAFEDLVWRDRGHDYALPAGTVVMAAMYGCALVGSDALGFDVDRPGLHSDKDLPCRPRGRNLARLLKLVDDLSRDLPCREIGMPALVQRFIGRHPRYRLRFPPFAPAGGASLERDMDFCSVGDFFCAYTEADIQSLAKQIVDDMRTLWTYSERVAPSVRTAWEIAERATSALRDVLVHAVAIDVSSQQSHGEFLTVEFEGWDHTLRRGIVAQDIGTRHFQQKAPDVAALDLADKVDALRALDADGRIAGVARAIAEAAPQGPEEALKAMAHGFETNITLSMSKKPLDLRLFWQHGEIRAATRGGAAVEISEDRITLRGQTLPETLIPNLLGKQLRTVFDHPFNCASPIAAIENKDDDLVITVEPDLWLVDCKAGRMWRDS